MVNTQLFQTLKGVLLPKADAVNHEQAPAYAFSPRHQLAQLAATGCLNHTFYASAEEQLGRVLALAREVDPSFVAKTALHARRAGHMKDMPALLLAVLATRDVHLLEAVFGQVVDNGKMLRNFVQIVRSGVTGRKSLGSRPKKLVQHWLQTASELQLLQASVGNSPSLADVVKMVHPKPAEAWQAAWFAWLIGKPYDDAALPPLTWAFERFKHALLHEPRDGQPLPVLPDVPFQLLTALPLTTEHWAEIARKGSWQMLRQNLNTFARHGVFAVPGVADAVAAKLRDASAVMRARVLPYQLLAAYKAAGPDDVPAVVRDALQDAMEAALVNVPVLDGHVVVCPDVSGSMSTPVTGHRGSATSAVRCIDVAALVAAAFGAKNPRTQVLPFEQTVVTVDLNPRDSVMTNAANLAAVGGGGTNVSAPLARLNQQGASVDLVVIVSDNQSWVDARGYGGTETMRQWSQLKSRCPLAKLVCIDLQPYHTTQAAERPDVMNVGGFSDAVFGTISQFAKGTLEAEHWVGEIEKIPLEAR
ncbi:RNA-binding protein [Caldimonas brevitalea]|uniref:RNA-binding protein n=1 Tax=Caldimonas brevitalea TaxID=413882 RepID=A0A0G3BH65_9BURK|nr:RNA-binding protein [Caldimonas brevitalea]AKJ27298.1 RNA-binding protein [Caldimonas brevitalea]